MNLKGLEAYQPSYMLLPNFTFLPDGQVQLGSILPAVKGSSLPDPNRPQNSAFRVPIESRMMNGKQDYEPWTFDSRRDQKNKTALQASISLLTGVGGHLSGERSKARELMIDCDHLSVESFRPDKTYLVNAIDDDMLQTLARKLHRPPLYMITGLMVARGAVVRVSDERGAAFGTGIEADVTSQGLPLNIGMDIDHTRSGRSTVVQVPTEPFILAYQIVRLRKKGTMVTDEDQNKWGLFNDEDSSDPLADWDVDWYPGGI